MVPEDRAPHPVLGDGRGLRGGRAVEAESRRIIQGKRAGEQVSGKDQHAQGPGEVRSQKVLKSVLESGLYSRAPGYHERVLSGGLSCQI